MLEKWGQYRKEKKQIGKEEEEEEEVMRRKRMLKGWWERKKVEKGEKVRWQKEVNVLNILCEAVMIRVSCGKMICGTFIMSAVNKSSLLDAYSKCIEDE